MIELKPIFSNQYNSAYIHLNLPVRGYRNQNYMNKLTALLVSAPRMAGFLVKMFVWFLESRIFGPLLLYFLKRNNLIHKVK